MFLCHCQKLTEEYHQEHRFRWMHIDKIRKILQNWQTPICQNTPNVSGWEFGYVWGFSGIIRFQKFNVIPNCELDFGFKLGIDVRNLSCYQGVERIESWLKNTSLNQHNCNLLKVFYLQRQHSLSGFNVIRSFHNLNKNVLSNFSDQI